ncbi:MAG TPA: hypothetical protein VHD81_07645 [Mycobacteriales bacterium]|nr:hypothetical protein [Mycobacteriales bacterium]
MRLAGLRSGRTRVAVLPFIASALVLGGCADLSQLQFHADHDVKFVAPEARAKLSVPVTLRWEVDGFRVAGPDSGEAPSKDAGYFALFVDRAPIKPGQTLAAVGGDDPACADAAHCLTKSYLADRQVYWTTDLSYTLRQVPSLSDNRDNWQLHEVTIVLLDTAGRRIGEHAYFRDFQLKRDQES